MQRIDLKKHRDMLKSINKYEEYVVLLENLIPENHDAIIRDKTSEFKGTYDYYHFLLKELERCLEEYKNLHESLKRMIYPYSRKMNAKYRNQ